MRRERGRRAGGAWVRRTRSDGRAPRSCVRSARFVSSAIRVGIPEADWADLGAAAELTPSGARDARSGRRTSCPVDLAVQQSDDPLAGESSTRHGSPRGSPQFPSATKAAVMGDARAWDDERKRRSGPTHGTRCIGTTSRSASSPSVGAQAPSLSQRGRTSSCDPRRPHCRYGRGGAVRQTSASHGKHQPSPGG